VDDRKDTRSAAERIERGIERYGDGDLAASALEFEEALRLSPGHTRARALLAWVRDVAAGVRAGEKRPALDEDAVRAVAEALDSEEEEEAAAHAAAPEVTWQPVPLTNTAVVALDEIPVSVGPGDVPPAPSAPAVHVAPASVERAPVGPLRELHQGLGQGTILGMAPVSGSLLAPGRPAQGQARREDRRQEAAEDGADAAVREFRNTSPTGKNLPPLDVPELTEEQVHQLASLQSPRTDAADAAREAPAPEGPPAERKLIELEAEPTPLGQGHPSLSDTIPDMGKLHTMPFPVDFDPMERIPTRQRSRPSMAVVDDGAPAPGQRQDMDSGSFPTDPFIRGGAVAPAGGEPPPAEPPPAEEPPPLDVRELFALAEEALLAGQMESALQSAEAAVAQAGGFDADTCVPYLVVLDRIYSGVVGSLQQVPCHGRLGGGLEPREAFLLSRLDGSMTVEDLLDVSGMPQSEALRTLALLIRRGAVVMK
jgi:hypothetical protein